MSDNEAAWRKAIADQVRANCTIDFKPERVDGKWVLTLQGDAVISAVCDWIENPPEWSKFTAPLTPVEDEEKTVKLDPEPWVNRMYPDLRYSDSELGGIYSHVDLLPRPEYSQNREDYL